MTLSINWERSNPGQPNVLTRWARSLGHGAKTVAQALIAPHKAALARLRDIPLTVAGIGCFDWAAFHVNDAVGLLVTGATLIVLEHLIAEDDPPRHP